MGSEHLEHTSAAAMGAEEVTCSAKYVFLDVVQFTHRRNVEAQSDIIRTLNWIIHDAVDKNDIGEESRIFIPTGDGICIALINTEGKYSFDIHMLVASEIITSIDAYNNKQTDEMRKFQVRIGINANEDNLITDINERSNLAGAGISLASRIMDKADGNQILVGESVYDRLQQRQKYMGKFNFYPTTDKHGRSLRVYQYVGEFLGLNINTPKAFEVVKHESKTETQASLPREMAYYLALAIKHRTFISKIYKTNTPQAFTLQVLLYLLGKDLAAISVAADFNIVSTATWKFNEATFEQQFEYYKSLDFSIITTLQAFVSKMIRANYEDLFEYSGMWDLFVNEKGLHKLKDDFPGIWKEFELDKYL